MTEAAPAPARVVQLVEAAQRYHRKGWVPLRLVGKDPQYMGKGWQKRQHDDPLPLYTASSNIGILTGEPSRDVVRLDADYEPIPEVTRLLHPEPTLLFGRASNPFSGRLVRSKVKSRDYRLPKALAGDARLPLHGNDPNLVVFQVLSTGKQTMMPPSIHPSGEEVVWQADDVLAEIDPEELYRRAGLEAFLMAVRHFWPAHGSRNEAAWSLARVLLEALEGSIADDGRRIRLVDELVVAVAVAGGGMGEQSRMGKVRAEATLARMRAGEAATGMTRLLELMELPEAVGKRFRQWLGDGPRDVGGVSWRERNQRADRLKLWGEAAKYERDGEAL